MTTETLTQRIKGKEHDGDGDPRILVLGGGYVGQAVAESLANHGTITFVDESEAACQRASDVVDSTYCDDPVDAEVLTSVGADHVDTAVVATAADRQTFLATQLLRARFGVDTIVARADDPKLADVIGDQTDAVVTAPPILAEELGTAFERVTTATARW